MIRKKIEIEGWILQNISFLKCRYFILPLIDVSFRFGWVNLREILGRMRDFSRKLYCVEEEILGEVDLKETTCRGRENMCVEGEIPMPPRVALQEILVPPRVALIENHLLSFIILALQGPCPTRVFNSLN